MSGLGLMTIEPIWGQEHGSDVSGARNNGLGGQGVVINDLEGYLFNSAVLAQVKYASILLNSETRFLGTGIRGFALHGALPTGRYGALGGLVEQYGLPEYHQQKIRLGYARQITQSIAVGSSFGLKSFNIPTHESGLALNADLGLFWSVTDHLDLGWSSFIPFFQSIWMPPESSFHFLGLKYKSSEWISWFVQLQKENGVNWILKLALEYWMVSGFGIRIGFIAGASGIHTGFGYKFSPRLIIDGAFSIHPALGITPALSLRYQFKPLKDEVEKL